MRIAYLTTTYPAVSHTFIRRELREMERRGHSVFRLAIREADAPPVDPEDREEQGKVLHCLSQPALHLLLGQLWTMLTRPLAFAGALALACRMARRSDRGLVRHLAYLLEACYLLQVLQRARVEHVHVHFGTNPTAVARLIRRLGGPDYSFTVHGPAELDAPVPLDLRGKVADAAFVVAISDYCSAQLRRWIRLEDWPKIHVVRCTVGDAFFEAAAPINPDARTLVCVGRLCPAKGQALLIDAMSVVVREGVDARLVLAGDGEMRLMLEHRIREAGLSERVVITGWIDEEAVRRHLLAARALVLPSFAEGLPMVIMEAMAMERPVISTYVAGIPELVRPGENGWLVPAGNVEQLTGAIVEAMQAPVEQLRAMGASGRERVRQRHYLPTETEKLDAILRQVKDEAGESEEA